MDRLVEKAKKEKKWKPIPDAPRARLIQLKKLYVNNKEISAVLELYELFRDMDKLEKIRENEFRKGVNLKVNYLGNIININLIQLKDYAQILERFISQIK